VHVRVTSDETEAVIEVADEGPGMAGDDANRVFERFWRSDPSRTRSSGGAGLGLAIVAAIAAAHGGRAEVQSEIGHGSRFRVHLPHVVPLTVESYQGDIPVTDVPVNDIPIAEVEDV
jgi:two-component system OmpR family sensor kinase